MKFIFRPGEIVLMHLLDDIFEEPVEVPLAKKVIGVTRFSLEVPESRSRNGLARIECRAGSKAHGTYTYEYFSNVTDDRVSQRVLHLLTDEGERISTASFISSPIR